MPQSRNNPIINFLKKLAGQESHLEDVNIAVSRASQRLIEASLLKPDEILETSESSPEGLSESEVSQRINKFGRNEVSHEKMPAWYRQLIKAFINPFIGILVLLAVTSYVTEVIFAPPSEQDITTLVIITILILISVLLTFFQEYQANQAADKLLAMVQTTSTVQRSDSGMREIPTNSLVPGDIVHLAAGDIIPADVYLLKTIIYQLTRLH